MRGDEFEVDHTRGTDPCGSCDAALAALAARQHGVVSRAQLVALGFSRRAIEHRVATGRLHALHRGVYAVGHRRLSERGRWMAAVLAAGPDAVLSHRSAAALWGLTSNARARVEVTVPSARAARPGLELHTSRLPPDERTVRDGIPVTTVPRTLLDLAAVVPAHRVRHALHEADVQRLTDPLSLADVLARHRGRRGTAVARRAIEAGGLGIQPATSELDIAFTAFLAASSLPPPQRNVLVAGCVVDAFWPAASLVVELDGYEVHGTRRAFERDRARDRVLALAGLTVTRVTWRRLHADPGALERDLRALLASIL